MNKYLKLFFHRIAKDFKQRELLPLKLLFFMHSSTILVLYPYLTIHMRELGINVEETAIMSGVTPVIAILMPPLAGMLADKIGNFRIMLALLSGVGGASALLLLLVPVGRITLTYPNDVVLSLSCPSNQSPMFTLFQEQSCMPYTNETQQIDFTLQSCGVACNAELSANYSDMILASQQYDIQFYDLKTNTTLIHKYNLSQNDIIKPEAIALSRNHRTLKNNEHFNRAIRKLSLNSYFFPTSAFYNFSCDFNDDSRTNCLIGSKDQLNNYRRRFDGNVMKANVHVDHKEEDLLENQLVYSINYLNNPKYNELYCERNSEFVKKHLSVVIPINNKDYNVKHLDLGMCSLKCIGTTPRKSLCNNLKSTLELDMQLTFWTYLCVRVFVGIVSGTSFAMFEGAVIAILREHKADYGLQRIYATIGGMISSPISGWLIDFASKGKEYTDFRPIFFLYAGLKIISGILMLFINLEFKKAATSVVSDVMKVLKKIELIAMFISCLILGCAWGFIENFLFWLLEDLGGTKSLMGLTITVGGIIGIPLLVLSGPIIKKVGHANIIFIGFVFYAIRLLGYSLIYNPWLCLIFEAMESITFGLSFTAAVTYAARLSTVTTDTSIQGMLGGLYYGVGKGVGSLVGGFLINNIGIRHTFQTFSVVTLVTGLVYVAFYHLFMKHRPSDGTDITKKDKPKETVNNPDDRTNNVIPQDIPAVYEDGIYNTGFQNNENEDDVESQVETRNNINRTHLQPA